MSKQYAYVDLGEGKKAILAEEVNGQYLPVYEEEIKEGEELKVVQKTADVFHLLEKVPAQARDIESAKNKLKNAKNIVSPLIEKGIIKEEDFYAGNKEVFEKWFDEASTSIEKAKTFDSSKTKDIEEIKKQLDKSTKEKLEAFQRDATEKESKYKNDLLDAENQIRKLMISDKFASSDFIKKNCDGVPVDVIAGNFSHRFKVEKDQDTGERITVGYKLDGNPIFSLQKVGDIADFDEAIGEMIKEDKNAGFYLSGLSASGTGNGRGRAFVNSLEEEIKKLSAAGDWAGVSRLKREQKK